MVVDLTCSCEAHLIIDNQGADTDDRIWLLVTRFVAAHLVCGYAIEETSPDGEPAGRLVLGPMDQAETPPGDTATLD